MSKLRLPVAVLPIDQVELKRLRLMLLALGFRTEGIRDGAFATWCVRVGSWEGSKARENVACSEKIETVGQRLPMMSVSVFISLYRPEMRLIIDSFDGFERLVKTLDRLGFDCKYADVARDSGWRFVAIGAAPEGRVVFGGRTAICDLMPLGTQCVTAAQFLEWWS